MRKMLVFHVPMTLIAQKLASQTKFEKKWFRKFFILLEICYKISIFDRLEPQKGASLTRLPQIWVRLLHMCGRHRHFLDNRQVPIAHVR